MAVLIPTEIDWKIGGLHITDGGVLRYLNPGPFNSKEHAVCCRKRAAFDMLTAALGDHNYVISSLAVCVGY
jgi:hypothetical protein